VVSVTCTVMSITHTIVSVTWIFLLALKRATCAQSVMAEQSFSLVAGPVRCLYETAKPMLFEHSFVCCWFHWDLLQVAISYTLSASRAWSYGSWRCWVQRLLASWQITIGLANEGKLLCGRFSQAFDVDYLTLSRHLAHRWLLGCQSLHTSLTKPTEILSGTHFFPYCFCRWHQYNYIKSWSSAILE
jgi:hypothetical protein